MARTDIRMQARIHSCIGRREMTATASLLRILHLASPALPIGGFHFSQGLEYAVERGWVSDESSAADWIEGLLAYSLGCLDLPVFARLYNAHATADAHSLQRWNAFLIAARETRELRAEDRHMGAALAKLLLQHELRFADCGIDAPSYATVFAFACHRWQVGKADALASFAWIWAENQVLAAVKLVPLGQSAGQRMLHRLTAALPEIVERAHHIDADDVGIGGLRQGIASARHESQYTRLFRS